MLDLGEERGRVGPHDRSCRAAATSVRFPSTVLSAFVRRYEYDSARVNLIPRPSGNSLRITT